MSPSATPATQTAAACTAPNGNQARHQSQPSAISATPAMSKLCGDKLCVSKLCVWASCVWASCVVTSCVVTSCVWARCVCVWASCVVTSCVCVCKLCVRKLCGDKLCGDKLCGDKLCVSKVCVSKSCGDKLCGDERRRAGEGRRERRGGSAQPKTRTPHKDVGNNFSGSTSGKNVFSTTQRSPACKKKTDSNFFFPH